MSKTEPKTLSGFMELMPNEQIMFNKIKDTIIETYKSYGFYPLDTPVIEYSSVLLAKAGGETEKQIYRFEKGDNDLSLRFDLTVPLAKYVAKRYNDLVFPFKRYQVGKVFRGERPQKGRFREFYQCDIDIIGDEVLSLKYDSEIIAIINDIFTKLDLGKFVVRINNRKILSGFFESLGLEDKVTDILRIVDKLDKIGKEEVIEILKEFNISEDKVNTIIDFISLSGSTNEKLNKLKNYNINNETFKLGVSELESVIIDLESRSVNPNNYMIDISIARGLDYYTGTVYETILSDYPGIGSVCSGGRYENLAEYYTDKKLPGVGVSIGLTRLFYQLVEAGIIKIDNVSPSKLIILPMTENYKYVYDINNLLRSYGVNTDICYLNKGFKQKMKYANKMGNKYIVIIGDNEVENNTIVLKNMISGEQVELGKDNLVNIDKMIS